MTSKDSTIEHIVYLHFGNKTGKVYSWDIFTWGIQVLCENGTADIYFAKDSVFFHPLEG